MNFFVILKRTKDLRVISTTDERGKRKKLVFVFCELFPSIPSLFKNV